MRATTTKPAASTAVNGRSQPPDRVIRVAHGEGWALWWPHSEWQALTPAERREAIARQRKLVEGNRETAV